MKGTQLSILEFQEGVAVRLRLVLMGMGVPYKDAAKMMGITPQRLNGWLNDGAMPSMYHLTLLCRALPAPVTMDYLLLGDARSLRVDTAERLGLVSSEKSAAS